MSDASPILSLPYILPAQAQKHVTHNEALRILDKIVQLVVADSDRSAPPDTPQEGACHIVGPTASGVWAGQENAVAVFEDGAWTFLQPRAGWRAHVLSAHAEIVFDAVSGWQSQELGDAQATSLGIGAAADATNRLVIAAPATLLNNDGAGHQLKINKALAADTASLLFQTGWSGRAEMGTAGDDDWSVKVSADGASWTEALRIDAATGQATGAAVQSSATDTTAGRLMPVGAFGLGGQAPNVAGISVTDMDDLTVGGMWTLSGVIANTPYGTSGEPGTCLVIRRAFTAGAVVTQFVNYLRNGEERLWYRQGTGNPLTWGDWREVYHSGSLLGTVSQSGGTPTGAVIERGENANGDYVRWADGTQICTHDASADATGEKTWNFPAAFAARPQVSVSCGNAAPRITGVNLLGQTAVNFSAWDINGNRVSPVCYLIAIGRWF